MPNTKVNPADFTRITQAGLKAHGLAVANKAVLDPRLPPGCTDALAQDLAALGADVPTAAAKRTTAKAATRTQEQVLAEAYALVTAIRGAVHKKGAKDVQTAYGVGKKVSATVVKHVLAAIKIIVDRAKANTTEATSLGILSKDVQALEADYTAIAAADATQEAERANAPLTTKQRNQTAQRIVGAVVSIGTAGAIEFAKDQQKRDEFDALLAAVATTKAKKPPVVVA
ncbi:MAG: hypothetical protein HY908_32665 [Myxococcales bacterium]|nr:hypothetical protein [Myxococcales bacterium]